MEETKLINRALDLLSIYIKGKTIGTISGGFIGGGISILGLNNLGPYVLLAIRPELYNKVSFADTTLTWIAIIMIFIGAFIPLLSLIFKHYIRIYQEDLEKINLIYGLYDYDTFCYHMNRISNNTSIFDFEIDKIKELYFKILQSDFYFNDETINETVKRFGNELSSFNHEMALRVSPSENNPHLYNSRKNLPNFDKNARKTADDCNRLINSYTNLKKLLDKKTKKSLMRFFT